MTIKHVSKRGSLLAAVATMAIILAAPQAMAATPDGASWQPNSSEKLVKLPASYLRKAVEQDYRRSPLAAEMADTESRIKLKLQTLGDLRDAAARAEGELKLELRHQLLAEKRAYLNLMARHHDLRRTRAKTRIRLYENLLRKLGPDAAGMTPQRIALAEKQDTARKRFDASVGKVDMVLFRSSVHSESRYARDYAKNVAAIESLVHAINRHPMNAKAEIDGKPVCYMGAQPKKTQGKYKKRDETYILITHRPAKKSFGVVSLRAGYAFKKDTEATATIGADTFRLFTNVGHAFAHDKKTDVALVKAMIRGARMIIQGISSRGTKTTDIYSLKGVGAAWKAINKACKAP